MDTDIKTLIGDVQKAVADFRVENDKALAMKTDKGYVDAQLQEKVDRMNDAITEAQDRLTKRMNEIERSLQLDRLHGGTSPAESLQKQIAGFKTILSDAGVRDAETIVTAEMYKAYRSGLNKILRRGEKAARLTPEEQAAMEVGSDPKGGYLVTPDVSGRIIELQFETTPMRQLANVQSISSDALEGFNDLDEAGAGWVGEKQTRSNTVTPEIGKWRIPAHELYAQPPATQKLLDDAGVDIEAWLAMKVSERFSRLENTAFVSGNGVMQPRGFLTYDHGTPSKSTWNVIERIPTGAAGAFPTNPGDPFVDMTGALKSNFLANARWLMSRATLASVRKLKNSTTKEYIFQPDFRVSMAGTILGYPVVLGEDMPAIAANSLSIAFGDFNQGYQIVDRIGIRVLRDPYTAKPYILLYTTKRVGGDVVNFEAIKVMRFAVAAS